jgi:chorismate mutase
MSESIIFYPNNALYNISIDGFLRCLRQMYGYDQILEWLHNDGTLRIPSEKMIEIFQVEDNNQTTDIEKVKIWKLTQKYTELSRATLKNPKPNPEDILRSLLISNKTWYPNVFPSKAQREGRKIIYHFQNIFSEWHVQVALEKKKLNCAFCGEAFNPSENIQDNAMTAPNSPDLGSFPASFPNTFWNGDPQTYLCPRCKSLFYFQHLSGLEINRFFINTNSFKLNYILNSVFENYDRLDLSSALQKTLKNIKTIGLWSLSNIEIIEKNYKKGYVTKTFPRNIAKVIIKPIVLSMLQKTANRTKIGNYTLDSSLDLITAGNYSGLLDNAYKCLRSDDPFGGELSKYFSILYIETTGGDDNMSKGLIVLQRQVPTISENIQDSIYKMKFKLVEQIRVNNQEAILGILTRIFLSHNAQLPDFLIHIFNDEDNFKAKMYTFLGTVKGKKGGQENE